MLYFRNRYHYKEGKIPMKVREKTPDKILVNVDVLKSAITQDKAQKETQAEYENSKNVLLALVGGLTSCLLTLIPSWNSWGLLLRVSIIVLSSIFGVCSLWFLIKLLQSRKSLKSMEQLRLVEHIINDAKHDIRYTALLIICYQKSKTGEVKFMTERHGNYIVHCDMEPSMTVYDQKAGIINYLATSYSVHRNQIVDVVPLTSEPFFSIKPIHGIETQNAFVFFQIKLKKKAKQDLLSHPDVTWKTIQEMEEMPELMGRNQDIVMALNENKTKIVDSFEDSRGPVHIIWNITKQCPYKCKICATHDESRPELSTEKKLQVLNHIFSAKDQISTLDFAGGDPMFDQGIRTVIMQAINSLGEEHISVTTTGKGIQAMETVSETEISKLLRRCEITIDASHENLALNPKESSFSRNSPEYGVCNYEKIQSMSENIQHLVINIPIIDDDLMDSEIDTLAFKLSQLKQNYPEIDIEAQIIRLMPVGAFNDSYMDIEKYKEYQPINVVKKIKVCVEKIGIPCRYHCSLRVLPILGGCDSRCNMLDRKIGIDCSGNVFACTWGAYLHLPENCDIRHNPFYLGNLVDSELINILNGQGNKTEAYKRISREISNRSPKPYCAAISWFFKNVMNENNDPLAQ